MAWKLNLNTLKCTIYYSDIDAKAYYSVTAINCLATLVKLIGKLCVECMCDPTTGPGSFKELNTTWGEKWPF